MAQHKLPEIIDRASVEILPQLRALRGITDQVPSLVKKSHMKSIISGFTEVQRTESHRPFKFQVRKSQENLILPDTGIAFLKKKGMTPVSQLNDEITDILMPLSKDTYVHGHLDHYTPRSDRIVRKALASCAFESFVAPDEDADFKSLAGRIGQNAHLISDHELNKMININNLL
jgi:hypothetical protein